jgi:superfamily II DNA or RNA helicase
MKTCGKRASRKVYSHRELEEMCVARLGWSLARARRAGKEELCRELGIEWRATGGHAQEKIVERKVCVAKRSRLYPNRYTKEELVNIVRQRNPFMIRGHLLKKTYKVLCGLANIPFTDIPPRQLDDEQRLLVRQSVRVAADRTRLFRPTEKHKEKTVEKTHTPCLERGSKKPFQYQRRVVQHLQQHRGLIAVHSLGSGKTLTALYASQCYLDDHPTHRVVVVSPVTLIDNFKKEMIAFGDLRHADRYEFFSFQGFYSRYNARRRNCANTMLIIDEAHNLRTEFRKGKKKTTGKYCGVLTLCSERADRILLLTATPLVNRPTDIVPLLNMIRDTPTQENRVLVKDFKKHMHNDDYLRRIGAHRFSFYERERVNDDYPRVIEEDVFLPMPQRFLAMYRKIEEGLMEDDVLRVFGETRLKPFFNGIRRAVNILSELPEEELVKSPKIKWILQKLREDRQKTLVFSNFLEMGLEGIQKRLPPGIRSAFITGQQPRARRAEIVQQFNNDEIDVLFLSRAGGEGIDLKGTRRIILLENGWNENSEKQVIGRGVRFRSHAHLPRDQQNVHIYRLFHIKPDEQDNIGHLLSPEYEVVYDDPTTWISADLMLKKISERKLAETNGFLDRLRELSIERTTTTT